MYQLDVLIGCGPLMLRWGRPSVNGAGAAGDGRNWSGDGAAVHAR